MTIVEATKRCFSNYVTFSGRASRSEFWKFILFIFLCLVALVIINSLIFGPTITQGVKVTINAAGEQSQMPFIKKQYNSGWLGTIFSLAVVLPWMAAAWRRLHDSDRPGYFVLLPFVALALSLVVINLTAVEVPIDPSNLPQGLEGMETMSVPSNSAVFLAAWLFSFASFVLVTWWLCRPSTPGENNYGPNPNEVPS